MKKTKNKLLEKINIVFEDKYFLIVNKPSGLIVQKTNFETEHTLENFLEEYLTNNKVKLENLERAGICHRLDKDTEGLLIVGKTPEAVLKIQQLLSTKEIKRKYLALVKGVLKTDIVKVDVALMRVKNSTVHSPSQNAKAKNAVSFFRLLQSYGKFSLIECELETGRTHQIRSHLKFIKNYLINDPIYGNDKNTSKYGQYLIAHELIFNHPFKTKELIHIKLPLPKEFEKYIKDNV